MRTLDWKNRFRASFSTFAIGNANEQSTAVATLEPSGFNCVNAEAVDKRQSQNADLNALPSRMIVVSNRLPTTVGVKDGKVRLQENVGGLATGLSAYLDTGQNRSNHLWIGSPTTTTTRLSRDANEIMRRALVENNLHEVSVPKDLMRKFYYGFCNRTLWPLFHYFPNHTIFDEEDWSNYKQVNRFFSDAVLESASPNDLIWVHDYHLMLVPALIRRQMPFVKIGFFLHTPFPSYELFRLLPRRWGSEILNGILGADLVGFHTYDYTTHFLRCLLRILGYDNDMGKVFTEERVVKADTFPMGIDFNAFTRLAGQRSVISEMKRARKSLGSMRVILSIDRLDYTKGIVNRLLGFERFLERNESQRGKVVLTLQLTPSRTELKQYDDIKSQIDQMVGRINGKFGTVNWTPILYQSRHIPLRSLVALYKLSDVALVTPLRDGMNLVAKEYLAARTEDTGVLILSEMAGASSELGEAVIVNPNDIEEVTSAIETALAMPVEEQRRRNRLLRKRLKDYNVFQWGDDFVHQTLAIRDEQRSYDTRFLDARSRKTLEEDFAKSDSKLIMLDFDGTIAPISLYPDKVEPNQTILSILSKMSQNPNNTIIILSGRTRKDLDGWFGGMNLNLVAEHGVWIKETNGEWVMPIQLTSEWKSKLLPTMRSYVDRLPGSSLEEKEFTLLWHYRAANPELSSLRAKELADELTNLIVNTDLQVLVGQKTLEVRSVKVNKGTAADHFLAKANYHFVLALGDDRTDEDMFKVLKGDANSIRIGIAPSRAKFYLRNQSEVQTVFEQLQPLDQLKNAPVNDANH